ncbi:MAG: D-alanyl-D-alanine carboxypeptidase/D-alanyl-D-alanine-endopeptidase [Pseudomonadota bacterium]
MPAWPSPRRLMLLPLSFPVPATAPFGVRTRVSAFAAALTLCLGAAAHAQTMGLPAEVEAALERARIPRDAMVALVADIGADATASVVRLRHRDTVPVNPASLMKLVTTFAALEQLGPTYSWATPVYIDGPVRNGVLQGNLYIQGRGDPKLVSERLWLLMRRVQGLGIQQIAGNIVLDRSAFTVPPQDPGAFDGERLRPYNAAPDALLVNYKSLVFTFVPDRAAGVARVQVEPPLAGFSAPATVPLQPGECNDWRAALKADFADAARVRWAGAYPTACGERVWPVAAADPRGFAARAVAGMWAQLGGTLTGAVREGSVPGGLAPAFEVTSPSLAEVVRDVNKFSNNVMAQQLFLTLGLPRGTAPSGAASFDAARAAVAPWWRERMGADVDAPVIDNGSGLSRDERISARALARLLQVAWASPSMPELMSSLPIAGVDGTMRRARLRGEGTAHLKTGSLRDVTGVAGYVLSARGQRRVLVAIVNHAQAHAARPAIEALVDWAMRDAPAR